MFKYCFLSDSVLIVWVKSYSSYIDINDYISGGEDIYIIKSRKVNSTERLEVTKNGIDHGLDYKITAKVYKTTYADEFYKIKGTKRMVKIIYYTYVRF